MGSVDRYHDRIVELNGGYRDIKAGIVFGSVPVDGSSVVLEALLTPSDDVRSAPDELVLDVYYASGYVAGSFAGRLGEDIERVRGHLCFEGLDTVLDELGRVACDHVPF